MLWLHTLQRSGRSSQGVLLGPPPCPARLLRPLQAPESVADVGTHWVRFASMQPPLMLEAPLQIKAAPSDPAMWSLR